MAEYVESVEASEFLQDIGLSAHYLVYPDGKIAVCVNPENRAYHAGVSAWKGENDLNQSFIGIEVLVPGNYTWGGFVEAIKDPESFNQQQYEACGRLCNYLMLRYPDITMDRILRHSEVSGDDVRGEGKGKIDPGTGFDMDKLKEHIEDHEETERPV